MSDSSIIICVPEILDNNLQLSEKLISLLQERDIIKVEQSSCTFSVNGYARSGGFDSAVIYPDEGQGLTANGLEIKTSIEYYGTTEVNPELQIFCPCCGEDFFGDVSVSEFYTERLPPEKMKIYDSFVQALYSYTGEPALLSCVHCGEESDITLYDYNGKLAFSNFAIEMFNCSELKPEFISLIETVVGQKVSLFQMLY